jgi:hypothetical protein
MGEGCLVQSRDIGRWARRRLAGLNHVDTLP